MGLKRSFAHARTHVGKRKHGVMTQQGERGQSAASIGQQIKADVAATKHSFGKCSNMQMTPTCFSFI